MDRYTKHQYRTYLTKYLDKQFGIIIKNSKNRFNCPVCHQDDSAVIYPNNPNNLYCLNPNCTFKGDIFELVRKTKNAKLSDDDIADFLNHKLDITIQDEIKDIFKMYVKNGFCLFPIARGTKIPTVKEWQKTEHKNPEEWMEWFNENQDLGLNIGHSGICVVDIDDKKTMEKFKELMGNTLVQRTARGWHFVYKKDSEFFKTLNSKLRNDGYEMELRVTGAYCVVAPSSSEGEVRKWNNKEIAEMPKKLKDFFMKYYDSEVKPGEKDDEIQKAIDQEKLDVVDLSHKRNDTFIKTAGVFRKWMDRKTLEKTLGFLSYNWIDKPIPHKELKNILGQVEKYEHYDKKDLADKIFRHLKIVEEGSSFEIATSLRYEKKDIEDALKYLIEEGKVYKRGKNYRAINKAQWKETFVEESKILPFKVPYFHKSAIFRNGDMVVIGGKPGAGKSTIAMNIIQKFVKQGIKPHYINLESGNRFVNNAMSLGLKEGDFYWTNHYNPQTLELEDNAVTILDWLLPENYAETDKLYAKFSEKLDKHGGLLIVFVQLKKIEGKEGKEYYQFFAQNQIDMFPAFVCKYTLEGFETTKIRESKTNLQNIFIPTVYDHKTKILELR